MLSAFVSLTVAAASLLLGASAYVGFQYASRWRRSTARVGRLLPRHVWLIAASYDLLLLAVVLDLRANPFPSWGEVAGDMVAVLLGLAAMWSIGRYQDQEMGS